MVSSQAIYHQSCRAGFSWIKSTASEKHPGRPELSDKKVAFEATCSWLEKEEEIKTVSQFSNKMKEFLDGEEPYGNYYIKQLLGEKYGSHIVIKPRGSGKVDLITLEKITTQVMENEFMGVKDEKQTQSEGFNNQDIPSTNDRAAIRTS